MDLVPAPKDLLQELAALELPPEREARLVELVARREQAPLTKSEEVEYQAWAALRNQFEYLRGNARRLLGEEV